MTPMILTTIAIALLFDFVNGMNDAANSIATVVSTRVLPPGLAVAWAALFNFLAAFFFGVHVATTIGKGVVDPAIITPTLILGALIGASGWAFLCTHFGLPISVSHSLIGGLAGAAVMRGGTDVLIMKGIIKVGIFIVLSPLLGLALGILLMIGMHWLLRSYSKAKVEKIFGRAQLFSAAVFSLSHGANDAQKTMGIIAVLLFSQGLLGDTFHVPWSIILLCHATIALGTLAGGWRVIQTMGTKLTKLRPVGGFAAETAGGLTIISASLLGIPVSTTHTITGAIAGVGAVSNVGAVRWGVFTHIVWAWVLTIPVSAAVGAATYWLLNALGI
ncbi:MAG: inorganic phosphate transporter [Deltaproteobacteria bacterium]|nr:inorganic phosphate transporter [Deltaproteobacteria bacterium]